MRQIFIVLLLLNITTATILNGQSKELKDARDSVSYSFGIDIASKIKQQKLDTLINLEAFYQGINDALQDKAVISETEIQQIIQSYFADMQKNKYKDNMKKGEQFLAENKKKEGVKTLPSGLQYKVLKEGTGETPSETDKVKVHYTGTLIDGTKFDSSYDRGEPAVFPVNGVIKGWTEALLKMKEGAKWKLFIPHELAYGERGAGQQIPPYSTLIFEVELISIVK